MSLRVRLGLLYGSLLTVTLVLFATLLYFTLLSNLSRQTDNQLRQRARLIERGLRLDAGTPLSPEDIPPGRLGLPALEESGPGMVAQVLDDRGRVLASSDPRMRAPLLPTLLEPAPESGGQLADVSMPDSGTWRALVHPVVARDRLLGTIQVATPLEPTRATMANVLRLLTLGAILALGITSSAGWWLTGRALAPLRRITTTARGIAVTGEIGERLRVRSRRDEVGQLASAFNAMIERLDESARRQRAFLADTSHELRSPLTVLRGNLDLLRRDPDPAARVEYLREADAEARRMARLVNELLLLAQSDARQSVHLVPLALEQVVREVYEQALMVAEGPQVHADYAVHAPVLGDADRLKQLLWNLLDNALRYTAGDGSVSIALALEADEAVVRVIDTGPGIPAEHLPHIFERFYRVDRARSRTSGGTGLGLAIVQYLAEAHGGRVEVESALGVGTTFTVRLPLAPQPETSAGTPGAPATPAAAGGAARPSTSGAG